MRSPPGLTVKRVSIGRGIVALQSFRRGERICTIDGRIVGSARVWSYWTSNPCRAANCFRFDADRYLDPHGHIGAFANHSCAPNASVHKERGCLVFRALKPILPGDEITHDYSTLLGADDGWTMRCACRARYCRRTIASIETLSPSVLRRLRARRAVPAFILTTLPPNFDRKAPKLGENRSKNGRPTPMTEQRETSKRCAWCGTDPIYVAYHDTEWGVPVTDDRALFEKLILDGFQAGLSWITILRKRDAFIRAFRGFDPERIARFTARDRGRLLKDASIIRSRAKIAAAISNAKAYNEIMDAGGSGAFRDHLWQAVDHRTITNNFRAGQSLPTATPESESMSRTLKHAGFSFCGPTICYAFMQAVGMVNDHAVTCPRHAAVARLAR